MILVFLGAPGSGKGTVSALLQDRKSFIHISSGVAFRDIAKSKDKKKDIKKLQKILNSGKLVDDDTVFKVIKAKLNEFDIIKDNIILDGFPRTMEQVKMFSYFVKENSLDDIYFINFKTTSEIIKKRISGRISCPKCGRVYNVKTLPPKKEGICDLDGTKLIRRPEDENDKVEIRLQEYYNKTAPLLDFYDNLLVNIDASKNSEEMYKELIKKIGI
ncbi:MAG: adenylate kinase [Candidatus Hepatoplasma vulgare]|nr:MAG: adenylate kinase [Candidatus Hepatoplasma sp.]